MAGRRSSGRWGCRAAKAVRFLFPHAPVMPVTINNGMSMRAWYDFKDADFSSRADLAGVRKSQAQVEALIAREVQRGIDARRIVLAGFSQGGAIALYAGLDIPSGWPESWRCRPTSSTGRALPPRRRRRTATCPIFMAHGTQDPVVRFAWAGNVAARAERRGLAGRLAHLSDGPRRGARGNRRVRQIPGCRAALCAVRRIDARQAAKTCHANQRHSATPDSSSATLTLRLDSAPRRPSASRSRNSTCALALRNSAWARRSISAHRAWDRCAAGRLSFRPSSGKESFTQNRAIDFAGNV